MNEIDNSAFPYFIANKIIFIQAEGTKINNKLKKYIKAQHKSKLFEKQASTKQSLFSSISCTDHFTLKLSRLFKFL